MTKPTILLVDDVNLLLELEKSFLKFSPVRVLTARNGEEALAVVAADRPDLIFMDLNMPIMDGAACCRRLKESPATASIPVVMVTTAGRPEDENFCRSCGCDDYITKPIDRRIFLDMGRKYLPFIDRREPRVPCSGEVSLDIGDRVLKGEAVDVSLGGIYIAALATLQQDEHLTVSFKVSDADPRRITAQARVAWENPENNQNKLRLPVGFGLEFLGLDERTKELLREFINRQHP
jgi:CheY-like chemotaxis protein